ncbi:hypothetical protein DFH94DRAFT_684541 [Russula ochroleuca]|uniref:Uncharacterized protein n=1 Tax=Russula ochroleuca TaxID=152965 RepID=A0A9P5MR93_9AGAM|nr:hypothetical protein DFH94DRAFT_684541 [Russula ochroleuca]
MASETVSKRKKLAGDNYRKGHQQGRPLRLAFGAREGCDDEGDGAPAGENNNPLRLLHEAREGIVRLMHPAVRMRVSKARAWVLKLEGACKGMSVTVVGEDMGESEVEVEVERARKTLANAK